MAVTVGVKVDPEVLKRIKEKKLQQLSDAAEKATEGLDGSWKDATTMSVAQNAVQNYVDALKKANNSAYDEYLKAAEDTLESVKNQREAFLIAHDADDFKIKAAEYDYAYNAQGKSFQELYDVGFNNAIELMRTYETEKVNQGRKAENDFNWYLVSGNANFSDPQDYLRAVNYLELAPVSKDITKNIGEKFKEQYNVDIEDGIKNAIATYRQKAAQAKQDKKAAELEAEAATLPKASGDNVNLAWNYVNVAATITDVLKKYAPGTYTAPGQKQTIEGLQSILGHNVENFSNFVEAATDEEKSVYNTLLQQSEEKAQEYVNAVSDRINKRIAEQNFRKDKGHPWVSIIDGLGLGIEGFFENISQVFSKKDYYLPTEREYLQQYISEDLKDEWREVVLFDKSLAQFLFEDFTVPAGNMIPSSGISEIPYVGQYLGPVLMGVSATGQAYANAKNLGWTEAQARTYSIIIGASEAGLSYALQGFGKGLGKLSSKVSSKLIKAVGKASEKAAVRLAINFGVSASSEALEEFLQSWIDPILQYFIAGEEIDFDKTWQESLESAFVGGMLGIAMEGPTITFQTVAEQNLVRAGENYRKNGGNVAQLIEEARASNDKTLNKLAAKAIDGDLTNLQIGQILAAQQNLNTRLLQKPEYREFAKKITAKLNAKTPEELTNQYVEATKNLNTDEKLIAGVAYFEKLRDIVNKSVEQESKVQTVNDTADKAAAESSEESNVQSQKAQNNKKGQVIFESGKTKLTKRQSVSVRALDVIAKATGANIYLYESKVDSNNVRSYTDKFGEKITANGWYDPNTGDIHIDLNAGPNGEGVVLFTAAHELTHFIRQWSPDKFEVLANFLIKEYGKKNVPVEDLIRDQQDLAAKQKRTLTRDEAYEEMVADSMQSMLSDGTVVDKLAKLAQKDMTLVEKMKNWIDKFVKSIKREYENASPYSKAGEYGSMINEAERLQEIFYDALVSAGENYKGAGEEFTLVKIKNTESTTLVAPQESGVESAIDTVSNGKISQKANSVKKKSDILRSERDISADESDTDIKLSARDSEGNTLTEAQQEYFKDSKVRDKNGNLLVCNHGTDAEFNTFDSNFISQDNKLGYGFYFLAGKELQYSYKHPKKAYLNITNPITDTSKIISKKALTEFCDKLGIEFEYDSNDYDLDVYERLSYSYTGEVKQFLENVVDILGIDGVLSEERNTAVIFNSNQAKEVTNTNPTSDPDIRYSARFDQHSVETALWDAMSHKDEGYDNLILVSAMPDYIVDKLGIEGDFYIYRDHAYENMVSKEEAEEAGRPTKRSKENIHFHNFGIEKMTRAILSINNPIMTISIKTKDGNPAVIMMLDEYGTNKAPLYAVLSFYANKGINGDWSQRPHIVLTIAERNYTEKDDGRVGYDEIIKNAIKDGRVLDFDEKKRDDLSVIANTAGIGNITKSSLDRNITYFKKEVKAFKKKNNILYSERNPDTRYSERDFPIDADVEKTVNNAFAKKTDSMNVLSDITSEQNKAINRLVLRENNEAYRGKYEGGKHRFSDNAIRHIIAEHGDFLREGLRAQLPMSLTDIARHLSAIKDGKAPNTIKATRTMRGTPSILTSYEVNGYTLYAEEIKKSLGENLPSDLIGHTMYKAPTLATAAALATSARALPRRQSIVLYNYSIPNNPNLSTGNFVSDKNGEPAELYYISSNNTPKADTLLGGLVALSSDSANFTDKSGKVEQGYVRCEKPFYITQDNRVFDNSKTNVSAKIEALKKQGYDCFIFDKTVGDNYMVAVINKAQIIKDKPTLFSERNPDTFSNRSFLVNALENATRNDSEREKLAKYKKKIASIDAAEKKLAELNRKIQKIHFSKGKRDAEKTQKLNDLQAEATKIENRIDRYDKELMQLEASKPLRDIVQREKAKAERKQKQKDAEKLAEKLKNQKQKDAEALQKQKEKDAEILQEQKNKAEATTKAIIKRNADSRQRAIEGRHKTAIRNKIKRVVKDLDRVLNKGTKKRNVKIGLQDTVSKALMTADVLFSDEITNEDIVRLGVDSVTAEERKKLDRYADLLAQRETKNDAAEISRINSRISTLNRELKDVFIRERARLNEEKVSSALDSLAEAYETLKESEDGYIKNNAFVAGMYDRIKSLSKNLKGVTIKDMSVEQLEEVYRMYSSVKHMISTADKIFRNEQTESLSERILTVQSEILKLQKANKKDTIDAINKIADSIKSFDWNNQKPEYAFEKLGSPAFQELFWDAIKAEGVYAKDVTEAVDFILAQRDKFKYADWNLKKPMTFTSANGLKFKLTIADMMSIYAYSKRPQAYEHMTQGGFTFDRGSTYTGKLGIKRRHVKLSETYTVDQALIHEIIGTLTEEQINYVDAVQRYLTDVGEKGNEVSRVLYGIDIFNEEVYFPLKSDADYLGSVEQALNGTQTQVSLKNSGMTKETVPNANNPIVLQGFDDVVLDHINKMSNYHAFVLPIENLRRVFDNVSRDENARYNATKVIIESVFGEGAKKYFDRYITDLNGGVRVDEYQGFMMSLFSRMKKTAVSASLSVAVQQPFAIIRAMDMINPKYFVPLVNSNATKTDVGSQWEEMKKYAPVAIIKEMGGFDVGSSRTLKNYTDAQKYKGKDKVKGFFKDADYRNSSLDELWMWGATKGDEIGWTTIWKAVKKETAAQHPELKVGSEEFLQKCGERCTEVIVRTQVYDSVNSRSGMMRSNSDLAKFATSFMGEPTTTINMLENSMLKLARALETKKGRKKAIAGMGRTVGVTLSSIILTTLAKSLVYAGRDDDDKEKAFIERWAKQFGKSLTDDLNPLTMIPFFRDIVSICEGWNVERPDMSIVADIVTSIKKAIKDGCDLEEALALAGNVGNAFGLPIKNLIREFKGVINVFGDITDEIYPTDVTGAFIEGLTGSEQSKRESLYQAIIDGDDDKIEEIKGTYRTEADYETALKQAVRENNSAVKQNVVNVYNSKNKENTQNDIWNAFFSPGNDPSKLESPVVDEIYRIYENTGEKSVITPISNYNVSANGETYKFTPEQKTEYQRIISETSAEILSEAINDSEYKKLTDEQKAEFVEKVYAYSRAKAKASMVYSYELLHAIYGDSLTQAKYDRFTDSQKQKLVQEYFLQSYSKLKSGEEVEYFIEKVK